MKDQKAIMSEVSKVHTGPSIQSNVTYVEGVKSSSICTIRAVILCMLEVLKVHTGLSIQSNVTHVEGVESSSICTIKAGMLYMSEVLKEATNGLEHFCS